ncbi:MAG TPA: hypothetical protein VFN00_07140 [Arthrobacter sp.]|nr:hypothetical protein [Arthrobacter sp.]
MTQIATLVVPAQTTFGRDGALFEALLGFVAQLSLVLWALVIFTVFLRFVGIRIYRRAAKRAAASQSATSGSSIPAPLDAPIDVVPPAVAAVIDAAIEAAQPAVSAVIDAAIDLVQPSEPQPATVVAHSAPGAAQDAAMPGPVVEPLFEDAPHPAAAGAGVVGAPMTVPYHGPRSLRGPGHPDAHLPALTATSAKS